MHVSSQAADKSENIAELGARLKSAKENSDWPEWLLNQAAANYWRVVGAAADDDDNDDDYNELTMNDNNSCLITQISTMQLCSAWVWRAWNS